MMRAYSLTQLLAPLSRVSEGRSIPELLQSHGFAAQASSGLYDLLPLGLRVQHKLEKLIRREIENAGGVELALTSQVNPTLWRKSGRLRELPEPEHLFTDHKRHLLCPTGEEQVTSLVGSVSYRQLPLRFYQITRKFRNELRPRGGLLRTREFLMKDLYSFDATKEDSQATYGLVKSAYRAIFEKIGVGFVEVEADSGSMGGDLSHEFHYLSDHGEDTLWKCENGHYDQTEKFPDLRKCRKCNSSVQKVNGIEVGHTFHLGSRYTQPLEALVTNKDNTRSPMEMGCYGIGISRLIAAIAQANSDKLGMVWPTSVAPATACVVARSASVAKQLAQRLADSGIETVYDDRTSQLGYALRLAKQAGWPVIVVAGKEYSDTGEAELIWRANGRVIKTSSIAEAIHA